MDFRVAAYCLPAGKYDATLPNCGNEDNFYLNVDLASEKAGNFTADTVVHMTEFGMVMAVCDGMGGMNAGEVASQIATETIADFFAPDRREVLRNYYETPKKRAEYLESIVVQADNRIKADEKVNPEHAGMGSTIIIAWIVGDDLTVTWCGDSRAYRFNPVCGLEPLSEDHSYVQDLVRKGILTYEDTFEHPDGNIVTRSLGDPDKKAQPETRQFKLYKDDIVLLCSDGLSGVLRDRKTKDYEGNYFPGENIEDIMREHTSSMAECRDELMAAAERADWYDNVTVLLCQILDGAPVMTAPAKPAGVNSTMSPGSKNGGFWSQSMHVKITPKAIIAAVVLALLIGAGVWFVPKWLKGGQDAEVVECDPEEIENVEETQSANDPVAPESETPGKPANVTVENPNNKDSQNANAANQRQRTQEDQADENRLNARMKEESTVTTPNELTPIEQLTPVEPALTPVTPEEPKKEEPKKEEPKKEEPKKEEPNPGQQSAGEE